MNAQTTTRRRRFTRPETQLLLKFNAGGSRLGRYADATIVGELDVPAKEWRGAHRIKKLRVEYEIVMQCGVLGIRYKREYGKGDAGIEERATAYQGVDKNGEMAMQLVRHGNTAVLRPILGLPSPEPVSFDEEAMTHIPEPVGWLPHSTWAELVDLTTWSPRLPRSFKGRIPFNGTMMGRYNATKGDQGDDESGRFSGPVQLVRVREGSTKRTIHLPRPAFLTRKPKTDMTAGDYFFELATYTKFQGRTSTPGDYRRAYMLYGYGKLGWDGITVPLGRDNPLPSLLASAIDGKRDEVLRLLSTVHPLWDFGEQETHTVRLNMGWGKFQRHTFGGTVRLEIFE